MCRRCTECDGMSHHWIDNRHFGKDPDDPDEDYAQYPREQRLLIVSAEYACKHCHAIAEECSYCEGVGEIDEYWGEPYEDEPYVDDVCPRCHGDEVIAIWEPLDFPEQLNG